MHQIWAEMETLVDKGLTRSIGISNFNAQITWDLLTYCRIKPVANEIELHPYNVQDNLVKFLKDRDVQPIAYVPLAKGDMSSQYVPHKTNIFDQEIIKRLSTKYKRTGVQILIKWGIQRGHVMIPMSNLVEQQKENLEALDFQLLPEEVNEICRLDQRVKICDSDAWIIGSIFA